MLFKQMHLRHHSSDTHRLFTRITIAGAFLSIALISLAPPSGFAASKEHKPAPFDSGATVEDMQGQPLNLEQQLGQKPLYLKFWASWCQPCLKEMPQLQQAYKQYGQDVDFYAININLSESDTAIKQVIKKYQLDVPVAKDVDGKLAASLAFVGTPYHILINKDGQIVHSGHEADTALEHKLAMLAQNKTLKAQPQALAPKQVLKKDTPSVQPLNNNAAAKQAIYFSSTWCDWYLKDSRPATSTACIEGQKTVNNLQQKYPGIDWRIVVSHMWTADADVEAYRELYDIKSPIAIDKNGQAFIDYGVRSMPTLVLLKDGKVIAKQSSVNQFEAALAKL
ncbi:TlpA family protein disulfide reductase [Agaribacterium haliotis]|uniref:TlpA family protein disulfide reductase n=1 Tax=Agaribacterium haliotis TaxID=2013869 RepID=UPI000BB59569|nr:TlpA disulfide reductase family protein [Agaribacterium haliotis]